MTVTPTVVEVTYAIGGTASLGPFSTVWPYEVPSDVNVWLCELGSSPVELALGADYTLAPSGDVLTGGGTVTILPAVLAQYQDPANPGFWLAGARIAVLRGTSQSQPTDFGTLSEFDPEVYTQALDHVERNVQDLDGPIARSVRVPPGDTTGFVPPQGVRANTFFTWDAYGNPSSALTIDSVVGNVVTITGPQGEQGIQGIQGIQGPAGAGALGYTAMNVAGKGTANGLMTGELVIAGGIGPTTDHSAGFRGMPVNEQDANYTFVLDDAGKLVRCNHGAATTYDIPLNAAVAFPLGTTMVIRNIGAGVLTLQPNAAAYLWVPGPAGATGAGVAHTLAQGACATLILETPDQWLLVGSGVT